MQYGAFLKDRNRVRMECVYYKKHRRQLYWSILQDANINLVYSPCELFQNALTLDKVTERVFKSSWLSSVLQMKP